LTISSPGADYATPNSVVIGSGSCGVAPFQSGSGIERETQVDLGGGAAAADTPALQRGLEDYDRDVHRVDGEFAEPLDEGPVEAPLRLGGAAGERGDLDQRVATGTPGGISKFSG
jgi:hypothetical protein